MCDQGRTMRRKWILSRSLARPSKIDAPHAITLTTPRRAHEPEPSQRFRLQGRRPKKTPMPSVSLWCYAAKAALQQAPAEGLLSQTG